MPVVAFLHPTRPPRGRFPADFPYVARTLISKQRAQIRELRIPSERNACCYAQKPREVLFTYTEHPRHVKANYILCKVYILVARQAI